MPWFGRFRSKTHAQPSTGSSSDLSSCPPPVEDAFSPAEASLAALTSRVAASAGGNRSVTQPTPAAPQNHPHSHSRSSSQPFPFPTSKKHQDGQSRDTSMGSNQGSAGHDPFLEPSSDEIAMQARMALSQSPQQMSPLKHSTPSSQLPKHRDGRRKSAREDQRRHNDVSAKPDGSVELRCMVCAHFNALAKREKCFRCSKCSTINDLIPYREPSRSDDQRDGRPESMPWNRVLPVTVDHTNAIISQCEYMYFCQLLRASLESTARPGPAKFAPPDGPCVRRDSPRVSSSAAKGDGKDSVNGSKSTKEVSDNAADSHQNTEKSPNRAGSPTKKRSANNQTQYRTRFSSRRAESIYKPLINYLHTAFDGCDTLNSSFLTAREGQENSSQPRSEGKVSSFIKRQQELDFRPRKTDEKGSGFFCTPKSPRIDWDRLDEWYNLVINVGASWREGWKVRRPRGELGPKETRLAEAWEAVDTSVLEKEVEEARRHVRQALLRVTEDLLKRPKRPLKVPDDVRFLLVLLANPLLFSADSSRGLLPARSYTEKGANSQGAHRAASQGKGPLSSSAAASKKPGAPVGDERDQYARVTKRILGIIANLNPDTQRVLCSWFSRYTEPQMRRTVELVNRFVTYRLTRDEKRKRHQANGEANINDFVPTFSSEAPNAAQLHDAISRVHISKPSEPDARALGAYVDDWQIHVAAKTMALLFMANCSARAKRVYGGPIVPLNTFYNTFFDYTSMVADFEAWESRSGRFTACQHPFLLSLFAKIRLLEFEAHRQMEEKARHAFFSTVLTRRPESQYMLLRVRRQCLVEDSLTSVSEVVATGQEDIKKGLKIEFVGEEGVDAGGLRKEWFLLLTRDIFNPDYGLFIYDEDSQYAYFNPYCVESSEQFYLVGVLLGLAIYNSTILDIALPPFLFRKLLASAPRTHVSPANARPTHPYKATLEDLAEYRPSVARNLQQLLDYDGDVRDLCLDFVIGTERYGEHITTPLCPFGQTLQVTNANRKEYVNSYVRHLLDVSVARQFDPFRNGFFTVCAGNALHLFRPEEIELLVRGSDEPLDIPSLRSVAGYEGFGQSADSEPLVEWFWDFFTQSSPKDQRKILSFVTGSDRIPATGAANLVMKIALLGDDAERYPVAHTCYNMVGLYRYPTREKFQEKFWRAVVESQGFGLK